MKRFLTIALTCLPLLCIGAPTYTTYFNNTHTYTNATVVGTNFAGRGVFTNGITAGASTFTSVPVSTFAVAWTNNTSFAFETFTTSGSNITSAINSSGFGIGTFGYTIVSGQTYRATFNLTLNSGTAPYFSSATTSNLTSAIPTIRTVAGANTVIWTAARSGTDYLAFWSDTGVACNFSVSGFTFQVVTQGLVTADGVLSYATISAPQNGTSERFGAGATSGQYEKSLVMGKNATNASPEGVVLGYLASSTLSPYVSGTFGGFPVVIGSQAIGNGVAIGYKASATNYEAVAVGPQAKAAGLATVAIGDGARAIPSGANGNEVVIGDTVWATGNNNWIIGGGAGTARDYVIGLGVSGGSANYDKEISTANNQGFLGWYQHDASPFSGGAGMANDWWLGGPVTASAPHAITLNITSGQGSNIAGVDFTITGSKATGNAESGDIIFSTGDVGSSGSTLQTATPKLTIKSNGSLEITKTITAAATTGDQTINKASGSVNFAAAAQTITVTDSLVTTNSVIMATVATDDTTAKSCIAVPGSGSFVLKLNAAATAETRVQFLITN